MFNWENLHWVRCLLAVLAPLLPGCVGAWRWGQLGRLGRRIAVYALGCAALQGASLGVIYLMHWQSNHGVERLLVAFQAGAMWWNLRVALPPRLRAWGNALLAGTVLAALAFWWAHPQRLLDPGLFLLMAFRVVISLGVLLALLRYRSWPRAASLLLLAAASNLLDAGTNLLVYAFFAWTAAKVAHLGYMIILVGTMATALSYLLLLRCLGSGDPLAPRRA